MRFANNTFILISIVLFCQVSFSCGFCLYSKACRSGCLLSSFNNNKLYAGSSSNDDETTNDRREIIRNVLTRIESNLMLSSPSDNSLSQLFKKCEKSVKVDDSSIEGAGMGLFATKNIKAGTIISLYPIHAVGVTCETETSTTTTYTALDPEDQSYFDEKDGSNAQKANYVHFLIGSRPFGGGSNNNNNNANPISFTEDETLFVDVNPDRPASSPWLSHYVNDGAIVQSNDEEGVLKYYRESNNAKNCVITPFGPSPMLVTVTTRKVKKGEEFFTSYGCSYWIDAMLDDEEESTDMTERIIAEARQTASNIFTTMNQAKVTYAAHSDALEEVVQSGR